MAGRALLACLAFAGLSLLLQGCGRDDDKDAAPDANVTTTATTTVTTITTTTTTTVSTAIEGSQRRGSFLAIGDWGWDAEIHGQLQTSQCQQAIADAMDAKMRELGDVQFVVNVGDSFYPIGVYNKTDPQWDTKWRDIYSPLVRSVPWYSVYGNHDYPGDPCACSEKLEDCAQINGDPQDLDYFYMPDYSWWRNHPEMGVEVVALDMNYYTWVNHTCNWSPCQEQCEANLQARADAGFELFYERVAASSAPNLVVFSHYPTDYFWAFPEFLAELSNDTRHHVEYFGGHRHNVDQRSTTSTAPNSNWLVGGGGGWGCEAYGTEQGFVVGEIGADYTLTTYPVIVDFSLCCG